jgi:outer membrane protein assembly factor BamB
MKSTNLKGKTIAIALILLLTMSSALAILPTIKAQTYSYTPTVGSNGLLNVPTFAGITASPDPVGVGQQISVIMLIELLPPSVGHEGSTVVYGGWPGYMLSITDPNGTVTTLGPYESDVSGTYQVEYTPDTTGTYTFQFTFPGYINDNGTRYGQASYGNYSANFLASTSPLVSLTVQQAPVTGYTEAPVPLPTQYWTSPINAQNRGWNSISGPWLQSGYNSTGTFNPYTYAPMSAHVLWTYDPNPATAGLVGGAYGSLSWGGTSGVTGTGYPEIGSRLSPIIMGGNMYFNSKVSVEAGLDAQTITTNGQGYTTGTNATNYVVSEFSCMNLQTGQILWTVPGSITYGQILNWRTQQQRMCIGYLWSMAAGAYKMYDAVNGQLLVQWFNQPAGTIVYGTGVNATIAPKVKLPSAISVLAGTVVNENPNPLGGGLVGQTITGGTGGGAMLVYLTGTSAVTNTTWLACWNSTLAINSYDGDVQVWNLLSSGAYPMATSTSINGPSRFPSITDQLNTPLNWENGIMWNYTIPTMYTTNANGNTAVATPSIVGADGQYIILSRGKNSARATGTENYEMEGFPLTDFSMVTHADLSYGANLCNQLPQTPAAFYSQTATPAWVTDLPLPAYDQTYPGSATLRSGGNIIYPDTTLLTVYDYSESTGQLLWSDQPFQNDFSMQSVSSGTVAYGMLYMNGYDGYMHAINATTGVQQWVSVTAFSGLEMPEIAYPASGAYVAGATMGSGVVFCSSSKAYETIPLYRGHSLWAYNATTGAQIWNISGEMAGVEIANGILTCYNGYDGITYAFGSGPTATTVTAPMTPVTAGTGMIIQGTVTDQTPGIAMGTPAISDTWMTPWMQYMYMDQPMPTSATGVPVSIDAVDPNGNFIHLGTATSDITGSYSYQWTPPDIPGKYTIIATFSADNSYYGSSGETAAVVGSPTTTVSPTPTPTSVADMYFVPAIAGLFVLIAIVAIVLALLMLRKHP